MPFDRILDVAGPLVGALIGGLGTYLATRAVEIRRWNQQKKDRLAEAKRNALTKTLDWLDPMDRAVSKLHLQVSALLEFKFDGAAEPLEVQSKLISELAQTHVPSELRLLLPSDLFSDSQHLLGNFSQVCADAVRWAQKCQAERKRNVGLEDRSQKLDELRKQLEGLREKLKHAYLATFE
jgi:hypothetical protein